MKALISINVAMIRKRDILNMTRLSYRGDVMPTNTFYNLEESKRKQIFDACVDEFSLHTFSEASINQIIKAANISRGSFYQYFADKEDCYMYLLSEMVKEKMEMFKDVVGSNENDTVFDEYEAMFDKAIRWIEVKPKYYQIGSKMDMDNSEFIRKLLKGNLASLDYFASLIRRDQQRGIIRKEIDPVILTEMLFSINQKALMNFFYNRDFEGMKKHLHHILEIIRKGSTTEENHV
ncbi:MAG: TetR/AcrR family transcriptional regulator [Firmicutes bacterium HGW-Firmicutes-19]|jgi:TetR/AcrR family transcriptional regulator|nr:MAG: TetR/AcrR family transcriptional regulator [Firmicutes bacterium HGW-Firmicutes-19]